MQAGHRLSLSRLPFLIRVLVLPGLATESIRSHMSSLPPFLASVRPFLALGATALVPAFFVLVTVPVLESPPKPPPLALAGFLVLAETETGHTEGCRSGTRRPTVAAFPFAESGS